jgi:hypothetical protein
MWARVAYASAPWAAETIPNVIPAGIQPVPPPIPSATSSYTYLTQTGVAAWATRSWAGAQATPVFPGGGISVAPLPDLGIVRIWAWWPDAANLQIVRIDQDGNRTAVRGGFPRVVSEKTRRNLCLNPSFEAGLNGYTQLDINTTFTQVTTAPYVADGAYALRMTSTTTTTGATWPATLPGAGPYTIAFNLGFTTKPTAVTVTVAWLTSAGTSAGSTVLALSADQLAASLGQSVRHTFQFAAPSTAVSGTVQLVATGITAGSTQVFLDAVMVEAATTSGAYFDGSTTYGLWSGVTHLSSAVLSPVQVFDDAECPLDVPIVYEVYSSAFSGGRMRTDPVLLLSNGRTWLTHTEIGPPVIVDLRSVPSQVYGIERGVFRAMGAPRAITVTGATRFAPTGTIVFNAISKAEHDALLTMFDDGSPVLLRTPAEYHYDSAGQWLSLGDLTEDREGRKAWMDAWVLSAPYDEVDPPNPALVA